MRALQDVQATVADARVRIQDQRLILQAQVCLELPMPEHDSDLPGRLEADIERGGQVLKRRLFQQAIEQADAELLLAQRHGKDGQGIICRGTTPFTFKTILGTAKVRRRRIAHKADGTTEVPSAHAWGPPRQVALTPGLRDAACDGLLRDSAQQTVAQIDGRAGESGVLTKATVLGIVREEGQRLQAAARTRAEAVFARDPEALRILVPASSHEDEVAQPDSDDAGGTTVQEAAIAPLIGFSGGSADQPEVSRDQPREVDQDVALVELDEVKLHAQAHTGRKEVLVFTAVVMITGVCWHLAATSGRELAYQVGALLAVLGVHRDTRRLFVLADGARWIGDWFEGLGLGGSTMIVCW